MTYHHEALHTTHLVLTLLNEHLTECRFVDTSPKLKDLAEKAEESLASLYQAIGGMEDDEINSIMKIIKEQDDDERSVWKKEDNFNEKIDNELNRRYAIDENGFIKKYSLEELMEGMNKENYPDVEILPQTHPHASRYEDDKGTYWGKCKNCELTYTTFNKHSLYCTKACDDEFNKVEDI